LLKRMSGFSDQRDQLGLERGGRRLASAVAARVKDEAAKHV